MICWHDTLRWLSDIWLLDDTSHCASLELLFSCYISLFFSLQCALSISYDFFWTLCLKLISSWRAQLFWLDPLWLTWKLPNSLVRLDVLRLSYGISTTLPSILDAGLVTIFLSLQRSLDLSCLSSETDLLGRLMMADINISLLVLVHTSTITTKLYVIISHQCRHMFHWCKDQTWTTGFWYMHTTCGNFPISLKLF